MKKLLSVVAGVALFAGQVFAAQGGPHDQLQQQQGGLSLQDLIQKCEVLQSYDQIKSIEAQITCSAERYVWVNRGVKGKGQFAVPKTGVQFAAHIKGKYQSQQYDVDLSDLLDNVPNLLQKWRFNVMKTVTIKSCKELQDIADDASYCPNQFSQLQDQHLQQMVQQGTALQQTEIESENMFGEKVLEVLTTPEKVEIVKI